MGSVRGAISLYGIRKKKNSSVGLSYKRQTTSLLRLLLASLVILYSTQTSGLDLKEAIIYKGDQAPFTGVLVPENNYRWYQGEVEGCDYLRGQIKPTCTEQSFSDLFTTMGVSFLVGFGLSFVLFHDH